MKPITDPLCQVFERYTFILRPLFDRFLIVRMFCSVFLSEGWTVTNSQAVPVHWLARTGSAKIRRGLHRFHWAGAQNQGAVRAGRANLCPLQVCCSTLEIWYVELFSLSEITWLLLKGSRVQAPLTVTATVPLKKKHLTSCEYRAAAHAAG